MSEEEEKKAFRVVDKRRFSAEGETRADVPDRPQVEAPNISPPSASQPAAAAQNGRTDARARAQSPAAEPAPRRRQPGPDHGGVDFISFVASLATQALAAMGALPEARAQGIPVNLDMAREYIEILAMLQDRTTGNLSREEDATMQRMMSELKMAYVEITQRIAKGPPGPKSPQH
jgi:hypothetical protein